MQKKLSWAPLNKHSTDICAVMSARILNTETEVEADLTEFIGRVQYGNESGRCILALTVKEQIPYIKNAVIKVIILALSDGDEDAAIVELTFWRFRPVTSPAGYIVGQPHVNRIPVDYTIMKIIHQNTTEDVNMSNDELIKQIQGDLAKLMASTEYSFEKTEDTPSRFTMSLMRDTATREESYRPTSIESASGKVLYKFDNPGYVPVIKVMENAEIKIEEDANNAE